MLKALAKLGEFDNFRFEGSYHLLGHAESVTA